MMLKQGVSSQRQHLVNEPLFCDTTERLPLLRHKWKNRKGEGLLSSVPGGKNYTLVFEGDSLPDGHSARNVVKVASFAELMLYYGLLGASCEMYISPEYRYSHFELLKKLEDVQISLANEALAEAEAETVTSLLRKIPLDISGLLESPLAVRDGDVAPGIVDPEVVHKTNSANALLSEPYFAGRLVYYNMLRHTEELKFDHESDHVQGMLLLEAMRQAGIATTHLSSGLPAAGGMTLMSYCTSFYNYIEHTAPVIMRSYTSYTIPREMGEKDSFAICQVFQWGKLCAEATLSAVVFMNSERYGRHRTRTEKLSTRNKRLFMSKVQAMSKTVDP